MDFIAEVTGFLLTQGVLGILVLMMGFVIYKLYRQLQAEQEYSRTLQNLRLQDVKDFTDSLKDPLNEIATQSKSLRDLFTDFISKRKD